ncbi:MAG: alpha/beta hydrolase [Anaerolineales bacterium]|nr:alpha/beta hydrolase [Anaerolineales bacterium]
MPRSGGLYYTSQTPARGMPALLLIHGAGGSSASWPYQLRRLPGWQVFAPDLPGHGNSSLIGLKGSLQAYADAVWEWADGMGLQEAVLCGHSMGAAIALLMAHAAPQRTRGVMLLGSAARFSINPQLLEKLYNPARHQDAVRSLVQWSFARRTHNALRLAYSRQLMNNAGGVLYRDFKACAEFDFTQQAAQLRIPALVLSGAEDQMVAAHLSAALAAALPLAVEETVADAGHMLMQEQPDAVAAILEKTLQSWKPD